jgi:hypothetical protein
MRIEVVLACRVRGFAAAGFTPLAPKKTPAMSVP